MRRALFSRPGDMAEYQELFDQRFDRDHLTRRNAPSYSALAVIFSAVGILASLVYAFWLWGAW